MLCTEHHVGGGIISNAPSLVDDKQSYMWVGKRLVTFQAHENQVCKGCIYTPNILLLKYVPRKRNKQVLQVNGNNARRV